LVSCAVQAISASTDRYRNYSLGFSEQMTGLHLTAMFGLLYLSEMLLSYSDGNMGISADSKDAYGQTPLAWAAGNGHETVVELLLARDGVDLDSKDSYGQTRS
jgi:ankyrin repeat protein